MSLIIYNTFFLSLLILLLIEKKIIKKTSWVFMLLAFILSVIFIGLRFDVGSDYYNYAMIFKNYAFSEDVYVRPDRLLYFYLSKLFSFWEQGYVGVLAFYTLATYGLLFYVLKKKQVVILGVLIFFTLGYFVDTLDRVRQILAAVIVLYAYLALDNNRHRKFFIVVLLASFVHLTALVVILFYPFLKMGISNRVVIISVILLLILNVSGIRSDIVSFIYSVVPFYSSIYQDATIFQAKFNTGLGFLSKVIFALTLILYYRKNDVFRVSAFIGLCIYIFSYGNLNIERVAMYLMIALVIVGNGLYENIKVKNVIKQFAAISIGIYMAFFIQKNFVDRSHLDYQSVFSESFKYERFNER